MSYGFNRCNHTAEGNIRGKNLQYFLDNMKNDKECKYVGFAYNENLGLGTMMTSYQYGCKSDPSESWPLWLRSPDKVKCIPGMFISMIIKNCMAPY